LNLVDGDWILLKRTDPVAPAAVQFLVVLYRQFAPPCPVRKPVGGKTRITVNNQIMENFPADVTELWGVILHSQFPFNYSQEPEV